MGATDLQAENERLKRLLEGAQQELSQSQRELSAKLKQAQAQHEAVVDQFGKTVEDKQRQIQSLEHQLKLLLERIRGSRQERINPDQLLLFSLEELEEIAEQLRQDDSDDELIDESPRRRRKKRRGRRGKLPGHLPREVIRHELPPQQRACPCCGEPRQEIGVETSEQLELIPAQLKVLQHERVKYALPGEVATPR